MILVGDNRKRLAEIEAGSVQTCITSPPYFGLRDYGHDDQIGREETPEDFVAELVGIFRLVRDALSEDGTLWLNLGDSYNGSGGNHAAHHKNDAGFQAQGGSVNHKGRGNKVDGLKPKDLIGIPWRVAFALQADGWYLRSDVIWHKPNPMPESVTDRPTKSHEYVFLLSKSEHYFYDYEAIREPASGVPGGRSFAGRQGTADYRPISGGEGGDYTPTGFRNKRSVWTVATRPFPGAHFAVMPEALVEPCVLAGSAEGDLVLDPFAGSGTVGVVAKRYCREFVGVELNPEYAALAEGRINGQHESLFAMALREDR